MLTSEVKNLRFIETEPTFVRFIIDNLRTPDLDDVNTIYHAINSAKQALEIHRMGMQSTCDEMPSVAAKKERA